MKKLTIDLPVVPELEEFVEQKMKEFFQKAPADQICWMHLTPVECERLQGFPDNWTEGQADSHRYKQMGNAVAVPVVEWVIQNICDIV